MKNNNGSTSSPRVSSAQLPPRGRGSPQGGGTTRGFVPLLVILAVVVFGGATYALVPRNVLKSFFEVGDKPTEGQFGDVIDSKVGDGDVPDANDFADTIDSGVKPASPTSQGGPASGQFNNTIDSTLNRQDDRNLLGLKQYDVTKAYQAGDTTVDNQAQVAPPSGATQSKPAPQGCVSNPSPIFTHHITDVSKLKYVVAPPTMGAGPSLKPHGYIGATVAKMPLYAPMAMTVKDGSYYVGGPYLFDFAVSCEVTVRFGHMTDPVDALKKLLPTEPASGNDSRTKQLSGVSFAAGELIGYTTGTGAAGNFDFGVYNSTVTNRYANDPDWNTSATYTTAVCPFEYFPANLKEVYTSKFDSKILAGNPPHGESFCK